MTVLVGNTQKTFSVHEDLICARSKFFRNALQGTWTEAQDKIVKLPEDEEKTFELYLELLYTGDLPILCNKSPQATRLAKVYVLAEKIVDIESKNTIVQAILARAAESKYPPCTTAVRLIYEGTPDSCPARRLFLDLWLEKETPTWFDKDFEDLPKDFLVELARGLLVSRRDKEQNPSRVVERPDLYLENEE